MDRIVGDNANVNVKLFKLPRRATDRKYFKVTHPADSSRNLFVYFRNLFLKNVRNQIIDRNLKSNGEFIDLSLMKLLFANTIHDGLFLCWYDDVDPTNFDPMKVTCARNLFRTEMVSALRSMHDSKEVGFENVQPLVNFLEFF